MYAYSILNNGKKTLFFTWFLQVSCEIGMKVHFVLIKCASDLKSFNPACKVSWAAARPYLGLKWALHGGPKRLF